MEESKDLKAGMETSYQIGGKTVVLKPVMLGKMKKAMLALTRKDTDTFDVMQDYLMEILANGSNDFLTAEWVSDNITLPLATQIINDARTINGLSEGFFQKGAATQTPRETRALEEKTPTP